MKRLGWLHVSISRTLLILVMLGMVSCAGEVEARPRAWIDSPGDGSLVSFGTTVAVISHAYSRQGVAEVVLSINGEAYRRDAPATPGVEFVQISQDWLPTEEGTYAVQVQAYDVAGQVSDTASITVRIGEAPTEVVPSPVEVIAMTDTPTPVITSTATPVPTFTATIVEQPVFVPTDTDTPPPPEPQPPSDTTPPPAPTPAVPADGLVLSCRSSQTLAWLPVDDPSGISGYYVKLEKEVTTGNWQSAGGYGPISGKQVDVTVDCGIHYRWMVRAQDGAGNFSNWSAPSHFSINLN
jgi:hypothetical protein